MNIIFRKKKMCGVILYNQNQLQCKLRNDSQLGGDVNTVFVEILNLSPIQVLYYQWIYLYISISVFKYIQ